MSATTRCLPRSADGSLDESREANSPQSVDAAADVPKHGRRSAWADASMGALFRTAVDQGLLMCGSRFCKPLHHCFTCFAACLHPPKSAVGCQWKWKGGRTCCVRPYHCLGTRYSVDRGATTPWQSRDDGRSQGQPTTWSIQGPHGREMTRRQCPIYPGEQPHRTASDA